MFTIYQKTNDPVSHCYSVTKSSKLINGKVQLLLDTAGLIHKFMYIFTNLLGSRVYYGITALYGVIQQWRRWGFLPSGAKVCGAPLQPATPILGALNKLKRNINLCSSSSSSVVFCCTAGFWHPFAVSPYLSVFSCPFDCNRAICQIV